MHEIQSGSKEEKKSFPELCYFFKPNVYNYSVHLYIFLGVALFYMRVFASGEGVLWNVGVNGGSLTRV